MRKEKEKNEKKKIEKSINLKSTVKDEFYISKMVISFENVNIYNVSQNNNEDKSNSGEFGKNYEEDEDYNYNNKPILSLINKDDFLCTKKSEKKNINNLFMKSSNVDDFNINKGDNNNTNKTLSKTN